MSSVRTLLAASCKLVTGFKRTGVDLPPCWAQAAARVYKTFGEFVDDFKLMCNNAMVYNQKRSRVHKTAVTMLRAGIKQLQQIEVDACKELGCLVTSAGIVQLVSHLSSADLGSAQQAGEPAADQVSPGTTLSPQKASKAPPKKAAVKPSPPKKARVAPQKPPKGEDGCSGCFK